MSIDFPKAEVGAISKFFISASHRHEVEVRRFDPLTIGIPRWIASRSRIEAQQFQDLKLSIECIGRNVQPIKLRPLGGSADGEHNQHELVFGAGRLQAALELGLPVCAFVETVDERTAFIDYFTECQHAPSWRPWRLAHAVRTALDIGLFPSQRRLAEAVGCLHTEVHLLLSLSQLPAETQAVVERLPLTRHMAKRLVVAAGRSCRERLVSLSQAALDSRNPRLSDLVRSLEAKEA
ncbi:MAG: ParB/RepB/Spo0J family partition protein [Fimbriimonadaceae bacterium]|nr:ParB/RepB/Spo0J family partition protein [Fimbriimonadaceae bacterium]